MLSADAALGSYAIPFTQNITDKEFAGTISGDVHEPDDTIDLPKAVQLFKAVGPQKYPSRYMLHAHLIGWIMCEGFVLSYTKTAFTGNLCKKTRACVTSRNTGWDLTDGYTSDLIAHKTKRRLSRLVNWGLSFSRQKKLCSIQPTNHLKLPNPGGIAEVTRLSAPLHPVDLVRVALVRQRVRIACRTLGVSACQAPGPRSGILEPSIFYYIRCCGLTKNWSEVPICISYKIWCFSEKSSAFNRLANNGPERRVTR